MSVNLSTPATDISRIGKTVGVQLRRLGILTIKDLLFYFPSRHDDLSKVSLINDALLGQRVVLKGRLELIESKRSRNWKKMVTHALVSDNSGSMRIVWFNQPWIAKMFKPGDELYLAGEIKEDSSGAFLSAPVYEKILKEKAIHTARLVPMYPLTEKLSQKQIRFLIKQSLPLIKDIDDDLPENIKNKYNLLSLQQALSTIHFPSNENQLEKAKYRLKFDELFHLQLFACLLKKKLQKLIAPSVVFHEEETKRFVNSLTFKLTDDQRKAAWEILGDLEGKKGGYPMNRLLEGDVGSGKTVVVAIAALNCAMSKGQVAIMAPTEILAHQHFETFVKTLDGDKISVALLTQGAVSIMQNGVVSKDIKKKDLLLLIKKGEVNIVIGTHALIQESVKFSNLVMAVIDEQHRFGVDQRRLLKDKRDDGKMPHLLTLTATPIPRSLALVFYGDLDVSILKEMPKGRKKIETKIVYSDERAGVYEFVKSELNNRRQIFWTCPIIDISDKLGVKAAKEVFENLANEVFVDFKVGLLHGRMKSKDREEVMEKFKNKEIDILVATPVIEVGIDVPNASVIAIEGAERFGLAQLHQFRGRVGRGESQSYCFLLIESSVMRNDISRTRMEAFLQSQNGFELAEKDLELRGPGNVYGTAQTGFPEFKIASFSDFEIAKKAKESAEDFLQIDPELDRYPQLREHVDNKEKSAHLE